MHCNTVLDANSGNVYQVLRKRCWQWQFSNIIFCIF